MTTAVVVTRHRCDHCRRGFASKSYAAAHEARCVHNPANRTCATCVHFTRTPCCDTSSDDCGCKGLNECAVDAFETWRYDNHTTLTPTPDGWWTHTVDFRRDCDKWEAR